MRVHSNIALPITRRLPQIFGDSTKDAVGTTAPNALNSNKPSITDAMGVSGDSGVVSFFHDFTASDPDFTLWFWSEARNRHNPAKGWIKASESASGNTKEVPADCLCTFTIPERTPWFLQSDTAEIRNIWASGVKHQQNPNADLNFNAADDT